MILVDTSVLIDLLRGEASSGEIEEYGELATCFLVQCELYRGTRLARNTEKGEREVEKLIQRLEQLETGPEAAKKFSDLRQQHREIAEFDLMIAAICLANNADILTQDRDFEEIKELQVLKP